MYAEPSLAVVDHKLNSERKCVGFDGGVHAHA